MLVGLRNELIRLEHCGIVELCQIVEVDVLVLKDQASGLHLVRVSLPELGVDAKPFEPTLGYYRVFTVLSGVKPYLVVENHYVPPPEVLKNLLV